jgi:hypothetical protein
MPRFIAVREHDADFVAYGLTTVGDSSTAREFAAGQDAEMRARVLTRLHDSIAVLRLAPAGEHFFRAIAAALLGERRLAFRERAYLDQVQIAIVDAALSKDGESRIRAYHRAYDADRLQYVGDPKNY